MWRLARAKPPSPPAPSTTSPARVERRRPRRRRTRTPAHAGQDRRRPSSRVHGRLLEEGRQLARLLRVRVGRVPQGLHRRRDERRRHAGRQAREGEEPGRGRVLEQDPRGGRQGRLLEGVHRQEPRHEDVLRLHVDRVPQALLGRRARRRGHGVERSLRRGARAGREGVRQQDAGERLEGRVHEGLREGSFVRQVLRLRVEGAAQAGLAGGDRVRHVRSEDDLRAGREELRQAPPADEVARGQSSSFALPWLASVKPISL